MYILKQEISSNSRIIRGLPCIAKYGFLIKIIKIGAISSKAKIAEISL